MLCRKVRTLLSDYIDGQVSATLKSDLESHLGQCPNCTQFLKDIQRINEVIKLKTKEHPSKEYWGSYWPRMRDRLEKVETSGVKQKGFPIPHAFLPKLRLAMNGALALLVILTATLLYRTSREIKSLRNIITQRQDAGREKLLLSQPILTSQESMLKQAKLFQEIREVFPHNAKWVVTNNGKIDLGISSYSLSEKVATMGKLPMFLHFNIVRFDGISTEVVSSPKMMVLNGQEVNAKLDSLSKGDKTIYRYRCLPRLRPDGKIDIAISLSLDSSTLETTITIDEGETIELGRLKRVDGEYTIYLSARSKDLQELSEKI